MSFIEAFIEAKEMNLEEMMGTIKNAYKIPLYQRPYKWSKEQWEELYEDIDCLEEKETHFFGSIVVVPEAKETRLGVNYFELIDGQQRLATILIWLASIIDALKEEGGNKDTISHLQNYLFAKEIADQNIQLTRIGKETKEAPVPAKIKSSQKISDKEIIHLARIADRLQKHYYFPQDAEWAKEKGKIFIVQTRPVTTIQKVKVKETRGEENIAIAATPILSGSAASPGIGIGPVKILTSAKEIGKVEKGDVLGVARVAGIMAAKRTGEIIPLCHPLNIDSV